MPKKTKEITEINSPDLEEKDSKKVSKKTVASKKSSSKSAKKEETKTKSKKSAVVSKKRTSKKSEETAVSKKTATKKTKKTVAPKEKNKSEKNTSKKSSVRATEKMLNYKSSEDSVPEYYDLPYSYNETMIKLLAQTPKVLFVYWEISENDKRSFVKQYGDDFFNSTIPVLTVYNETKDYYFSVPVNDFANTWYIHVPDEDCKYIVKLRRIFKEENINLPNQYFEVGSSNEITNPNGHILIKSIPKKLEFINLKSKVKYLKDSYINSYYAEIYDGKFIKEFDLDNPSSNFKNS